MRVKVPKSVTAKLAVCEKARSEKRRREQMDDEAEREQQAAIDRMLANRYEELIGCAEFIFGWRDAFGRTKASEKVWGLVGEKRPLPIFTARFFNGMPAPANDSTVCARLFLERTADPAVAPVLIGYEELSNGQPRYYERFGTVHELVNGVHPDFLEQACRHLQGPDPWKFIVQELDRILRGLK